MPENRTLIFHGTISAGIGQHSDMSIPGRELLPDAPPDWPDRLCPGSLNVVINDYPEGFAAPAGRSRGVYQLDDGAFRPAFIIAGDRIAANKLLHKGEPAAAQVWRARLQVSGRSDPIACWVLRRLGSNVGKGKPGNVLEIVSAHHLRASHKLDDGQAAALILIEGPAGE